MKEDTEKELTYCRISLIYFSPTPVLLDTCEYIIINMMYTAYSVCCVGGVNRGYICVTGRV